MGYVLTANVHLCFLLQLLIVKVIDNEGEHMAQLTIDICEKLKKLGYARSNHVRLYGEQFQLISDPFLHEAGIAVEVVELDGKAPRTVKLPLPVLRMATAKSA